MITLINLNYIGARVVCRSGNVYTVAVDGTINVQPVDVQELCEQGYQQNTSNPFKLPWSAKNATFTCGPGSHGYTVDCEDPATLDFFLPPAAESEGIVFYIVPTAVGGLGVITAKPTGDDTIAGDPSRVVSVNTQFISNGVDAWYNF